MRKTTTTCSRGHAYVKSSECPVCSRCWPGYYRSQIRKELASTISAPALRALLSANVTTLRKLSTYSEKELLALHGVGPSVLPALRAALKQKGLTFKK